ncbi:GABA transporter [Coprinopsis cinerea AmutBmut pab1-1]|nr:GABA transporter [Coprinopsis cinerea AmutBmut pab1-1]
MPNEPLDRYTGQCSVVLRPSRWACWCLRGTKPSNGAFGLSVSALYITYAIPIVARLVGPSDFKSGPFDLGSLSLPCAIIAVLFMAFLGVVFLFPERPTPTVGDMDCNAVVLGGVLGLSLAWYYFPKYGGRHGFTKCLPLGLFERLNLRWTTLG